MAQTVALGVSLGASKAGLLVGYRLLNLAGTEQAAFTRTNVAESATIPGDYLVTVSVSVSDDGAIVVWGVSGTDYWQYTIDPAQAMTLADDAITDAKIAASAVTEIQGAAAAALTAYDPPTKTELDSAVAPLATSTALATVDTVVDGIAVQTTALVSSVAALPGTAAIVTAIMAYAVETGHSLDTVLKAIYAGIRGKSVADDADDPTEVAYYAPDNSTVRFTHTLTDTDRTVA